MNETIQILADGTEFIISTPYTPSESRAGVVRDSLLAVRRTTHASLGSCAGLLRLAGLRHRPAGCHHRA